MRAAAGAGALPPSDAGGARSGERGSIPAKVASLACRVIEARLRPKLERLMPFAEKRVVIG